MSTNSPNSLEATTNHSLFSWTVKSVSCFDVLTPINCFLANAAASIFTQRPHVLSTPKSSWALNETSFGYITDCGASYYLSRLPNEVGTYLGNSILKIFWLIFCHSFDRKEIVKQRYGKLTFEFQPH